MTEDTLEITLARSPNGAKPSHRATVRSLGLRRCHQTVRQPDRPEIRGMVARVAHLVEVRYAQRAERVDLEPGQEPKGKGRPAAGQTVADEDVAELREAEQEALAAGDTEPKLTTESDATESSP
ncbi:MAG: 50S ribosomal protein L30 [Actinobacteria bacterium QS_8_72_14]|jgi:large subunit ribosomal protein L30|nr:MAG: 50S ribosomal protein L30 [Actinobacteria bacterium QS_8_72_14]